MPKVDLKPKVTRTHKTRAQRDEEQRVDDLCQSEIRPRWVDEATWMKLVIRENGRCICCGIVLDYGTGVSIHHLMPRSRGGGRSISNLVLTCPICHDKLESAQEARLEVTNYPPTIGQVTGIFENLNDTLDMKPERVKCISDHTKHLHALRVQRQCHNVSLMKRMALRLNCWSHVNWKKVSTVQRGQNASRLQPAQA